MTIPCAISYPVTLSPAQLAYLLSLTGIQDLVGLADEGLFPRNGDHWERLFLHGRAELERDQWLYQPPNSARTAINQELLTVVTTMAAPDAVLVTTLNRPGLPSQSVTHYISTFVVEACYDGLYYRMAALSSPEVMLMRLASTLGLPSQQPALDEFVLSNESARQAVADPAPEHLARLGVPSSSIQLFARALDAGRRAKVQVMRLRYGQVQAVHRVRALFASESSAWLALPADGARVRMVPAYAGGLAEQVQALL
ncbi:MAG: hypothetical protein WAZ19_13145 [Anaerolineae bacterium]